MLEQVSAFDAFKSAWDAGGLEFVLFLALAAFLSGLFVTKRNVKDVEARHTAAMTEYKDRCAKDEARYEKALADEKAQVQRLTHMLIIQMGHTDKTLTTAEQLARVLPPT